MAKKRVATLVLSIALLLAVTVGGTLAYLTDSDSDANVMTLGNVQIEQQWNDDQSALEPFDQFKPLYPYVGELGWENTKQDNGAYRRFTMANVQDKYVSVKNTGASDAYVRTFIALEMGDYSYDEFNMIGISTNAAKGAEFQFDGAWVWTDDFVAEIDGHNYNVMVAVHQNPVKPGETTIPSLLQVYLKNTATNETVEKLDGNDNGTYDILVFSEAVQAAGFEDIGATAALNEAFGDTSDPVRYIPWDGDVAIPSVAADADAYFAAMTTLPDGTDIKASVTKIVYGKSSEYPDIVNGNYKSVVVEDATAYYVPVESNYEVYILSEGTIYAPVDSSFMFYELKNVETLDLSNLDFSQVENAKCMFTNCNNLTSIEGTEDWDLSNVTNMQSFFYGCNKLDGIDVSNWDTSNVTNMRMVFFRCYALDNETLQGVENWDVSNVSNFYSMFKHARGLTSLDLSKWDTSSATNMSHMFANIGSGLTQLDLSSFDTSKVTDMSWMFYDASGLTTIYVGDGWTTAALDPANPTAFYNNQALVGGNGTTWLQVCDMKNPERPWESSAKLIYAIVDGGTENPGLLTYKAN